jgi:hypothetical protein
MGRFLLQFSGVERFDMLVGIGASLVYKSYAILSHFISYWVI